MSSRPRCWCRSSRRRCAVSAPGQTGRDTRLWAPCLPAEQCAPVGALCLRGGMCARGRPVPPRMPMFAKLSLRRLDHFHPAMPAPPGARLAILLAATL
eukprot:106533-Chlamydomonas_euryale.AAC.1